MIIFFSGLSHHAKKLKPIFDSFGEKAFWLISDNSINIDPSVLSVPEGDRFFDIREIKVPEARVESLAESYISDATKDGFPFSPFWLSQGAFECAEFRIRCEMMLAEGTNVKAIVGLHENNFWVKQLADVADKCGIPSFTFQEGLLRHEDEIFLSKQATSNTFSMLSFCWTDEDARAIERASGKMPLVCGIPHLSGITPKETSEKIETIAIFPSSLETYNGDIVADVNSFERWASENRQYKVIWNCHPMSPVVPKSGNIEVTSDPIEAILRSDLCLVQHTTVGLEALALNVPIVEFNLSSSPSLQGWPESVPVIFSVDELTALIEHGVEKAFNVDIADIEKIKWAMESFLE